MFNPDVELLFEKFRIRILKDQTPKMWKTVRNLYETNLQTSYSRSISCEIHISEIMVFAKKFFFQNNEYQDQIKELKNHKN